MTALGIWSAAAAGLVAAFAVAGFAVAGFAVAGVAWVSGVVAWVGG